MSKYIHFLYRKIPPSFLYVQMLLILGCSAGRADLTIRYSDLSVDDWRSIQTEKFLGGEGEKGSLLRLEFTSDRNFVSIYSDKEKNIWFELTDCKEKKLSGWQYIYIGGYPIGGVDKYGENIPLPASKDSRRINKVYTYSIYFDFHNRYEDASPSYNLSHNYDLRIDDFDICLKVGAGSMIPFDGLESNILHIKNREIKSILLPKKD